MWWIYLPIEPAVLSMLHSVPETVFPLTMKKPSTTTQRCWAEVILSFEREREGKETHCIFSNSFSKEVEPASERRQFTVAQAN